MEGLGGPGMPPLSQRPGTAHPLPRVQPDPLLIGFTQPCICHRESIHSSPPLKDKATGPGPLHAAAHPTPSLAALFPQGPLQSQGPESLVSAVQSSELCPMSLVRRLSYINIVTSPLRDSVSHHNIKIRPASSSQFSSAPGP